ncbi:MAG: ferrous iron transport protein B, partial [Alistipes sp.]|nr:ferrous iron transport protein B [Alistipes sp.]
SYLGRLGKACEPVFRPLGLNWKAGVALLSGVPAKEIVVSTLGVLYSENETPRELPVEVDSSIAIIGGSEGVTEVLTTPDAALSEDASALSKRLVASGDFTTASALAFLVFILLYFPCIATVAAIGSEAGWKWAVLTLFYNTGLAWIVAWAVYHLALWI